MMDRWLNKILCGDCLDILREMPDKCIDTIITDPVWPDAQAEISGKERAWELFADAAMHFPRIAKRAVIHLGCDSDPRFLSGLPRSMPFIRTVNLRYARPHYKGRIMYGNDTAYVFGEPPKSRRGFHLLPGEFTHTINETIKYNHPCYRRLSHVSFLLSKFSDPEDTILDPFCGSGTTIEACINHGHDFIGIELNPEYVAMAEERIRRATAQIRMSV